MIKFEERKSNNFINEETKEKVLDMAAEKLYAKLRKDIRVLEISNLYEHDEINLKIELKIKL